MTQEERLSYFFEQHAYTVVGDLLAARLYIFDGSKAIYSAIRSYADEIAFIQRCQVHKISNVTESMPEAQRHAVMFRVRAAYLMDNPADAENVLFQLHDELVIVNPSAAGQPGRRAGRYAHRNGSPDPTQVAAVSRICLSGETLTRH